MGRVLGGGPRLLLVDDEAELAPMLRGLFVDEGYYVDVAANGQIGLHYGSTRSYDVVVLDRRLPVVEGLELTGTWRRRGITTPILVLSAQGNPAERVEGLDAGAEDYLAKPFDIDERGRWPRSTANAPSRGAPHDRARRLDGLPTCRGL